MTELRRPLTRQQRRAFLRQHAELAKRLDRPPTMREIHNYYEAQRPLARLGRALRRVWAYLNAAPWGPLG